MCVLLQKASAIFYGFALRFSMPDLEHILHTLGGTVGLCQRECSCCLRHPCTVF